MDGRVGVTYRLAGKLGPYLEAVRAVGLDPVPISPDAPRHLDGLRGLVLTGGSDVDPARYGREPVPELGHTDPDRDALELDLLAEAERSGLPVFGICRGLQLLNVARGGTLKQHIDGHHDRESAELHPVRVAPGTTLAAILGRGEVPVNSRHHQAIDALGRGLRLSACAPDGIVEAVEDPGRPFLIAVQWHPEDRVGTHESDRKLFQAFAAAVAGSVSSRPDLSAGSAARR